MMKFRRLQVAVVVLLIGVPCSLPGLPALAPEPGTPRLNRLCPRRSRGQGPPSRYSTRFAPRNAPRFLRKPAPAHHREAIRCGGSAPRRQCLITARPFPASRTRLPSWANPGLQRRRDRDRERHARVPGCPGRSPTSSPRRGNARPLLAPRISPAITRSALTAARFGQRQDGQFDIRSDFNQF